jgi:uroporphyrinogen-III synthase
VTARPRVAVFRPDDERITDAVDLLAELGAEAVPDPMLEVEPTGASPRADADYAVFTSKTGAELIAEAGWTAGETTVCAIGDPTAAALETAGYTVDLIPAEFSSTGLVDALEGSCEGTRIEVARSDHGSSVLLDGLNAAGAYVHETVLYRLVRPDGAGESAESAAAGELDAALFTSSLTVEHFLEAATQRGVREAAVAGLDDAVVAVIGDPTAETARHHGLSVDVIPEQADFETLARDAVAAVDETGETE